MSDGEKIEALEHGLIELYIRLKKSFILAEETDPKFKHFLQPPSEIAKAYDHLNRTRAVQLRISDLGPDRNPEEYIVDNLGKAKGHLYRAYFDILDWLAMNLRESIAGFFAPYSAESLRTVVPEYFTEIAPVMDEVSVSIAKIRNEKDVANSGTLKLLEEYEEKIEVLRNLLNQARRKSPGLNEHEERLMAEKARLSEERQKKDQEKLIRDILLVFLGVALTGFIAWLAS